MCAVVVLPALDAGLLDPHAAAVSTKNADRIATAPRSPNAFRIRFKARLLWWCYTTGLPSLTGVAGAAWGVGAGGSM